MARQELVPPDPFGGMLADGPASEAVRRSAKPADQDGGILKNQADHPTGFDERKAMRPFFIRLGLAILAVTGASAHADEGGASFWLPGQYGSFAAVPPDTGVTLSILSYYYTGSAGGGQAFQNGDALSLGLDTDFFAPIIVPAYTPDVTFLGARPSFSLSIIPAYNSVSTDVSIGELTARDSDSVTGFGDIQPTAQLFWSEGVNNWMAYVTGNIPVGNYDPNRLSNLGLGHAAIDFGGAYTYLNPKTGLEFSATSGVTFNFENPDTDYTSGVDVHLDLGAAKFLTEQLFVGVVGSAYQQLTPDEGQLAALGGFKSRTFGVGPQIGYTFDAKGTPVFVNLRLNYEFGTKNRVRGSGAFFTVSMPLRTQ